MDYHNIMIKEKDEEIKRLQRMLKQCKVCEEEKANRLKYLENILAYFESKLGLN